MQDTERRPLRRSANEIPEVKIFNTMTRKKEVFVPLEPGKVRMYACGPTVYNLFHLGNARMLVTFDLFRRFLEYIGYDVKFVQNFTDIDDKVIRKANEEGVDFHEIADRYIREYFYDADRLGVERADVQPRATDTMDEIIEMISRLVDKGYCYVASDGVYYETRKFADYGKLSHQPLDDLIVDGGKREMQHEQKRHAEDFAVWKFAKPGEPAWSSPWGDGRPGWHIECSAMNHKHLGETIDIHCGGSDLVFPHHENEIAQSEAANACTFARYWMHNGFINVDNSKMSKSKGNFFTVRDLAERFPYKVLRFFMLLGHYRSPINFSNELLESAGRGLERIESCAENLRFRMAHQANSADVTGEDDACRALRAQIDGAEEAFVRAMADDMNTSDALAVIFELVTAANNAMAAATADAGLLQEAYERLELLMSILGFTLKSDQNEVPANVLQLVQERTAAKKAREFARADAIRDELTRLGYKVEDTAQGPKLSKL